MTGKRVIIHLKSRGSRISPEISLPNEATSPIFELGGFSLVEVVLSLGLTVMIMGSLTSSFMFLPKSSLGMETINLVEAKKVQIDAEMKKQVLEVENTNHIISDAQPSGKQLN